MHDDAGRWFLECLTLVVVCLAVFHLTKGWWRPSPRVVRAATALGWLVVILVAVYAMFEIHRGR